MPARSVIEERIAVLEERREMMKLSHDTLFSDPALAKRYDGYGDEINALRKELAGLPD